MSGTVIGGRKAAATNKKLHGEDWYSHIGKIGGHNGHTGGFASEEVGKDGMTGFERARIAGAKGGRKSKRGPSKYPHLPKENKKEEEETIQRGGWKWLFSKRKK